MDIFIGSSKTGLTYAKKLKEMIEADSKGNIGNKYENTCLGSFSR